LKSDLSPSNSVIKAVVVHASYISRYAEGENILKYVIRYKKADSQKQGLWVPVTDVLDFQLRTASNETPKYKES
jgi:hypothetical protein